MRNDLDHCRLRRAFELIEQLGKAEKVGEALKLGEENVEGVCEGTAQKTRGLYFSRVRDAGVLIHRSGLLPSLAFMRQKGNSWALLRLHLLFHLRHCTDTGSWSVTQNCIRETNEQFLELTKSDAVGIQRATRETQKFLAHLKLFAEANFKVDHDALKEME